jgi:hypothetical protein
VPAAYDELLEVLDRLERHYRDMCDVEFTVSDGTLYILQTRIARRSPLAAVRIAVAMAQDPEFPLTRAEAIPGSMRRYCSKSPRCGLCVRMRPGWRGGLQPRPALASGCFAATLIVPQI